MNYKFTSDGHDAESNLEHTQFRQLSTTEGRWLSPDPAGLAAADLSNPQSLNLYAYVLNNPMNRTDPLGLYDGDPRCNGCRDEPTEYAMVSPGVCADFATGFNFECSGGGSSFQFSFSVSGAPGPFGPPLAGGETLGIPGRNYRT